MHIQREPQNINTIQAYSETGIQINDISYHNSLIVSRQEILTNWPVTTINSLTEETLMPLLQTNTEIVIIGHQEQALAPMNILQFFSGKRTGIEIMNLGAACRTFNILLSEQRNITLGIIMRSHL